MTNSEFKQVQFIGKRNLPLLMIALFAGAQGAGGGKAGDKKDDAKGDTAKMTAVAPAPEPTSDKLTEIRGRMADAFSKLQGTKFGTPEQKDASLELFKIENEEKAEIANIKKAEADAKVQEARNARIALLDNYDAATGDAKVTAREALINALIPNSASLAKKSGETGGEAKGGSKTEEIFKLMDAGATYESLTAAGYADGTIRSAAWKGGYKKGDGGTYVKS